MCLIRSSKCTKNRLVRKFLSGIGLPVIVLVATIWWRISWNYDIHPVQFEWCMWVSSLVLTSLQVGYGIRAYWWPGTLRLGRDKS